MVKSFSNICKATTVTHTKRIYRNLLRKETSFVYYTGRRFLKQPAEKLKAVFVAFDKERRIPAVGASTEDVDIN